MQFQALSSTRASSVEPCRTATRGLPRGVRPLPQSVRPLPQSVRPQSNLREGSRQLDSALVLYVLFVRACVRACTCVRARALVCARAPALRGGWLAPRRSRSRPTAVRHSILYRQAIVCLRCMRQ